MRSGGSGTGTGRLLVTPRVSQELVDRVSLVRVNAEQVSDEVLG